MSELNKEWKCEQCGTMNSGNYCTTCGALKPVEIKKAEEPQTVITETKEEPAVVSEISADSSEPVIVSEKPANSDEPTSTSEKLADSSKSEKAKQISPLLTAMMACILGLGAGFGGGYLAIQQYASHQEPAVTETTSSDNTAPLDNTASAVEQKEKEPVVSSSAPSIQDVAEQASKTVVEIQTENTAMTFTFLYGNQSYTAKAAGSGVILTEDGYIITNNHVVADSEKIVVKTYDGTEYEAQLVGTDVKSDIAVIKIDASGLDTAVIGDSDILRVGDTAIVIGNPLGTLGGTVTSGIISATNRDLVINNQSMNLIQTNAEINSGNSGGGLFNDQGQLVGIVNAKDSGTSSSGAVIEGIGFAIPINTANEIAQDLIQNGYVTNRATIGVRLSTVDDDFFDRTSGQTFSAGLYIAEVYEGSGADAAGLQAYDRIISADGTPVSSYTDLTKILSGKKVGDTLDLEIERNQETIPVTVTLTGPLESMTN